MKNIWTLSLVLLLAVCCNEEKTIYKNPDAPIEKRVAAATTTPITSCGATNTSRP